MTDRKINGDPYCVIPEQIAIQKLFMHQAKLDSITVSDAQVFQEVERKLNYFIANIGSKEKVEEYFNKPMSELREEMAEEWCVNKELFRKCSVSWSRI